MSNNSELDELNFSFSFADDFTDDNFDDFDFDDEEDEDDDFSDYEDDDDALDGFDDDADLYYDDVFKEEDVDEPYDDVEDEDGYGPYKSSFEDDEE